MKIRLVPIAAVVVMFGVAFASGIYAEMRADARGTDFDVPSATASATTHAVTSPDSPNKPGGEVRRELTEFKSAVKGVWLRIVPQSKERPHDISIAGG